MIVTCAVSSSAFAQPDTPSLAAATAAAATAVPAATAAATAAAAGTESVPPLVRVGDPACGEGCPTPAPLSAAGVVTAAVVGGSGFTTSTCPSIPKARRK